MPASRIPQSSQTGLHRRLDEIVRRHLQAVWRQPLHRHSEQAFEPLEPRLRSANSLILDSGCGTGESTAWLAGQWPDALVVGVDKSLARLGKAPALPANALLVRADLADFWRLLRKSRLGLDRHYLFYPNPWPKPTHLKRRWHAHPVWPDLLGLGGVLELRSNFEIYVREFARALELAGVVDAEVVSFHSGEPVSPFERKYMASGHRLWKLTVNLGARP